MSTSPPLPEDIALAEELPDSTWQTDGSTPLNQRTVLTILFSDPAVRSYTYTALGSLAMIFLILFQQGSDLGGVLVVVFGLCGVLFHWRSAVPFVLLVITYFMWTPFGVPGDGFENRWEIEDNRFKAVNVMLVLAVLVYVTSQYRLFGLVHQAMAYEGKSRRKDEPPTRRPPSLIQPSELGVLFAVCVGLVLVGHVIWWLINVIEVVPTEGFPLRMGDGERRTVRVDVPGGLPPGLTRFVLLIGLLFFSFLMGRLVFGYWRLRTMGPLEAGMLLADYGWAEVCRERSRLEKWRVWGRRRASGKSSTRNQPPTHSR
jgi:hypothetical protein